MKRTFKDIMRCTASLLLVLFCLLFAGCGGDDIGADDEGGNGNGGSGSTSSGQVDKKNQNANIPSADNGFDRAIQRIEFPALKKSGNQKVLVYRTSSKTYDKDGVNFSVEWDSDKRSQRWTCYQMHRGFSGSFSRVGNFYFDSANLSADEYWGEFQFFPGYERGHICPSGDRTALSDMNAQTFVMTNMQPQYHQFNGYDDNNSGMWLRMENKLRSWTNSLSVTDTIFVCKGGTIDSEANIIERIDGKLIVPKYFFVAVLRKSQFGYAAMGFWCEQTRTWRSDETLLSHSMSIADLEKLTGIDFFCNLPDDVEKSVEKTFNPSVWKDLNK